METTISGSDNSNVQVTDNPVTEPVSSSNETTPTNGQPTGSGPDDIFKGVDPSKLPPELKKSYDSMLSDYRSKTARISEMTKAEVEKATKDYREKASLYDQISGQEEFVKRWNDYVKEVESKGQAVDHGDPEVVALKKQFQEMNQKIQLTELSQVTNAFAEAVNEKGEKVNPQFDELNNIYIGQVKAGEGSEDYSILRACIELANGNSPQEKLANGYKSAKATYDAIFEAGKKAGMGRSQQKVLNGSLPPSNSGGEPLTVTDKKPKNAREALAMARRGQVVSRE